MSGNVLTVDELTQLSTEDLKHQLLLLTQDRDTDSLSQKVQFHKTVLDPYFQELARRNPVLEAEAQAPLVVGGWAPVWSTIPFQDTIPGRIHSQSYQIFRADGYYANMARYAPGHKLRLLNNISSLLLAYDFMVLQKYEIQNGQWYIQNLRIEQAFRVRAIPLSLEKADAWFTEIVESKLLQAGSTLAVDSGPDLRSVDKSTAKKFEKIFQSTPQLEHLYIDPEFRLVKSRREAKQRPSYTIALRQR